MIIIKTTVNNISVEKKITNELIKRKYALCINVLSNNTSIYEWENKIVKSKEKILFIKTLPKNESIVYKTIKKLHNYDIPEILTIRLANVDKNYLEWMKNNINMQEND